MSAVTVGMAIAGQETWDVEHVARRWLRDGSSYRIVKIYLGPQPLADRLADLGGDADIRHIGSGWVLGQARPVHR
jgi:hypothetical protein